MPSALRCVRLPVRPGRGNFYEGGVTKAFLGKLRLDANVFRRDFRQYSDDDVLLDTGVSFPIAFTKARIFGEEIRMEVPQWGRFSGYLSYANQSGYGQGADHRRVVPWKRCGQCADRYEQVRRELRINETRCTLACVFKRRGNAWLAMGAQYGSGLPANIGNANVNDLLAAFGQRILDIAWIWLAGECGRIFPSTWRQARRSITKNRGAPRCRFRWRTWPIGST